MFLTPVPVNSLAWTVGSIVMFYLSWRLLVNWRRHGNRFGQLFGTFDGLIGLALALFAYPVWLTHEVAVLRAFSIAGEAALYGAYVMMTYAVWLIYLKPRLNYGWLLVPAVVVAVAGWSAYALGVEVIHSADLLFFRYPRLGGLAHSLFLGGISLPFGVMLVTQGVREITSGNWPAVIKSFAWGGMTIGFSAAFVYFMYVGRGYVPPTAAYIVLATFVALFAALLPPASERRLQEQVSVASRKYLNEAREAELN